MKYLQASSWFHYGGPKSEAGPKGYVVRFSMRNFGLELERFRDIKLNVGRDGPTWFLAFRFRPPPVVEDFSQGSLRSHLDAKKGLRVYVPAEALGELRETIPTGQWRGVIRKPASGIGWDVALQGTAK